MQPFKSSQLDRRGSRRLSPKRGIRATCRKGTLDLGPNLVVSVVNISESGIGLVLSELLDPGQDVSLTLDVTTGGKVVKRIGRVIWCEAAEEGTYRLGIRLEKALRGVEMDHLCRP
jgi:NAD(P)H-nitrite reductase large subunit